MAIYDSAYLEDDDGVYRDIAIRHTRLSPTCCNCILKSFEFDSKHKSDLLPQQRQLAAWP